MIDGEPRLREREFYFPSDGTIPSDKKMWQPRLGIAWEPDADGSRCCA